MLAGIGCGMFSGFEQAVSVMVVEGAFYAEPFAKMRYVRMVTNCSGRLYTANIELFSKL